MQPDIKLVAGKRFPSPSKKRSGLVISLDFELFWGMRDHTTIAKYGENILGVREAIPRILTVFAERNIACTWATVGMLFARNKNELKSFSPSLLPQYDNESLNPYLALDYIGDDERSDPYHYAYSLIEKIQSTPRQELATHTFSHFYCLEDGVDANQFGADLESAISIMKRDGASPSSIVFPRNQYSKKYIDECSKRGILYYRGNEKHWVYKSISGSEQSNIRRLLRISDAYVNISGHHAQDPEIDMNDSYMSVDVPASRFLRPYNDRLSYFENVRLNRIKKSMYHAANNKKIFHLWFHPHNFGRNLSKNMTFLTKVLAYHDELCRYYDWGSYTMREIGEGLSN